MGNNQIRVNARRGDEHYNITHHETDAPLLPIAQIERLHAFAPDRVAWVFEQTALEAEKRRAHTSKEASRVFCERMVGMFFALVIGLCGIVGGIYAALQGHDWLGGIIASSTVITLAANFLKREKP